MCSKLVKKFAPPGLWWYHIWTPSLATSILLFDYEKQLCSSPLWWFRAHFGSPGRTCRLSIYDSKVNYLSTWRFPSLWLSLFKSRSPSSHLPFFNPPQAIWKQTERSKMLPRPPDYTAINDIEATPVPATDPLKHLPPKDASPTKIHNFLQKKRWKKRGQIGSKQCMKWYTCEAFV
jgi:hypothetical protein